MRVFFLLFLFLSSSFALQSLEIKQKENIKLLSPFSYLIGDFTQQEAYLQFKNKQFKIVSTTSKSFGLSDKPLWFAFEIANHSDAHLFLGLLDISIQDIEFFVYQNDILIDTQHPKITSSIALQQTTVPTLYLVKVTSSKPLTSWVVIGTEGDIFREQLPQIIIFFTFIGAIITLLGYSISLYLLTKESNYILYTLYVVFFSSWMILSHGYYGFEFFPLALTNILKPITFYSGFLFLILFSIQFLNLKNFYPTFFKIQSLSIFLLLFILISIVIQHQLTMFILGLFSLFLGYLSYIKGYSPAKYYLLAFSGYLLGIVIKILMLHTILPYNLFTMEAQFIGILFEIILLLLALGYKLKFLQEERNEAVLKTQIQEKMLFLQSRYASIGELVSNITHQWREPLGEVGSIQTNLQASLFLQGTVSKEKLLFSIDQSHKIIRHLSDTIDVFYRFFKHNASEKQKFDLLGEIQSLEKIVHYSLNVEKITLQIQCEENITLIGDRSEFLNAILNIILNAKDILVQREVKNPLIVINAISTNEGIVITIEDNGGGVKQEPLEKIFKSGISSKEESIGIGLFIVKTIVEQKMDGEISVTNTKNGALFTLFFPNSCKINDKKRHEIAYNMEETTLERIFKLERKVAKQEETEKVFKQWANIFEHAHWGIAMHIGTSDTFETTNPTFQTLYGYTQEELQTIRVPELFAPESLELLQKMQQIAFDTGYVTFEAIHKRKNGTFFPVSIELIVIKNEYGEIAYHIANIWDLTEKKEAQERLRLKKFALDNIQEAVYLIDEDAIFHYVNEEACKALGYPKEELLTMNVSDIDLDLTEVFWKKHWEDIKVNKTDLVIRSHKRKDNTIFPVEVSANYFEYNGKGYNLAIGRDITERIKLEEQKDNERMRLFFERQLVGMAITSPTKGWLQVNDKLCEMLGYSFEELQTMSWAEVTHPDDLDGDVEQFDKMLRGEIEHYFYEKRYIKKDGGFTFANLSIGCVRNDDGTVDYLIVLIEDITERKLVHEALVEKEQELRALADSSPGMMGSFYMKEDGSISMPYVSPNILNLFGLHPQDVLSDATPLLNLTHPDDRERVQESIAVSAQTMSVWHEEYRIIHPKKGERWMESNTMPQPHGDGGIIWYGYVHDITNRKIIEAKLKQNETNLREAQKIAKMGSWELDIATNKLTWSDETYRIFELNPNDIVDLHTTFYESVHSDDREMVNSFYTESITNKLPFKMDHRIVMPNGTIKYVLEHCETQYAKEGNPIRSIGTVQDITERKQTEDTIRALNETLEMRVEERTEELQKALDFNRGVINAIPDLMFEIDKEGHYLNVWAKDETLLAAQKELLLGNKISDVLSPEATNISMEAIEEADKNGLSFGKTIKINLVDGLHWFELSSSKKADGNFIFISRDITERKVAETLLQEREEKFYNLFKLSPAAVSITSLERNIYLEVNDSFLFYTKYTREEVVGHSSADLGLFANPHEREEFFEKVIQDGVIRGFEYTFQAKDGTIGHATAFASVMVMNGERCLLAHSYDRTGKKMAEDALKEREETFRAMVENSPDVIMRYDLEGRRTYINPIGLQLMNKPLEELIGKTPKEYSPLPDVTEFEIVFAKVISEGKEIKLEAPYILPNGDKAWGEQRIVPEFDTNGEVTSVLVIGRDLTERNKMEKQLKFVSAAVNSSSEAIYVNNKELSILYVNEGACKMLGYTYEELTAMKIDEIDVQFQVEDMLQFNLRLICEQQMLFQTKHKRKNGEVIDVEIMLNPFIFNDTEVFISVVKKTIKETRGE